MNSIMELSGQLLGLWLAIIGIAIVCGVLFAIGGYVSRLKRRRGSVDQGKANSALDARTPPQPGR